MLENIFIALGISFGLNLVFFIFAWLFKSDIFTDITYASTFLLTTLIVMLINNSYGVTSIILLIMVGAWSVRLGSYLLIRIWKTKVDHRFDNMRNSFWKFGGFWFLQAITVWLVNMQTYIGIINENNEFNYYSIIFLIFALGFLMFETIADLQKWKWMREKPGQFINAGLWKISRHPNYFGEYSFWWMLAGFTLVNNYDGINFIGLVGPVWITIAIYFLSGLPLLEKQSFKLFGNQKEYIDYLNNTPTVIPFIGKKGFKQRWKSE